MAADRMRQLELLAAIPWDPDIDMGDIAYGWLLAARCEARKNGALMIPDLRLTDAGWVDRAARCAELAVIAANAPSVSSSFMVVLSAALSSVASVLSIINARGPERPCGVQRR